MEMKLDVILAGSSVLDKIYVTANTDKVVNEKNVVINSLRAIDLLSIKNITDVLKPLLTAYDNINEKIVTKYARKDEDGNVVKTKTDAGDSVAIDGDNLKKYNEEIIEVLQSVKNIEFEPLKKDIIESINNINGHELNVLMFFIES